MSLLLLFKPTIQVIYTPFIRTVSTFLTSKTDSTPTNLANVETTVTIKTIDNPTNASDVESKTNSVNVETTNTEKTIG